MINSITNVGSLSLTRGLGSLTGEATQGAATAQVSPGQNTGASFASVLGTMASEAASNLKQAEVASIQGIQGKANTREVVDAVLQAEQSLQTAIALRDKVVSAYLEITKMQM